MSSFTLVTFRALQSWDPHQSWWSREPLRSKDSWLALIEVLKKHLHWNSWDAWSGAAVELLLLLQWSQPLQKKWNTESLLIAVDQTLWWTYLETPHEETPTKWLRCSWQNQYTEMNNQININYLNIHCYSMKKSERFFFVCFFFFWNKENDS